MHHVCFLFTFLHFFFQWEISIQTSNTMFDILGCLVEFFIFCCVDQICLFCVPVLFCCGSFLFTEHGCSSSQHDDLWAICPSDCEAQLCLSGAGYSSGMTERWKTAWPSVYRSIVTLILRYYHKNGKYWCYILDTQPLAASFCEKEVERKIQ